MTLATELVKRIFGPDAQLGPRLTGGHTITTKSGGRIVVLAGEFESISGDADVHAGAIELARALWGQNAVTQWPPQPMMTACGVVDITNQSNARKPASRAGSALRWPWDALRRKEQGK